MRCPVCNEGHVGSRRRIGPAIRELHNILVDICYRCGSLFPVQELDAKAARWVERYNKRMKSYYELRESAKTKDKDM